MTEPVGHHGPPLAALRRVLATKIALTLLLWGPPLLTAPDALLAGLGFPVPEPSIFRRLLGAAYVALVFGYAGGYAAARAGRFPAAVVAMGIVSNGLAAMLIGSAFLTGYFDGWRFAAQSYMLISAVATAAITLALIIVGPGHRSSWTND